MAVAMVSQFSGDGKYFANISTDGKLKLWNVVSNTFEQEFTPDYHLTSPCICLHFLQTESVSRKEPSPKKKKRRDSISNLSSSIILGTTSGRLLVYSIAKASLDCSIDSQSGKSISCLSLDESNTVYSGADQQVIAWDLNRKKVSSIWKAGNDKITAILVIPLSDNILIASKNITLWSINDHEVLKTFTGHSSDVILLQYIKPSNNSDDYFVSGSKGDRLLSCWNLNTRLKDKNAVASFLMQEMVQSVSIHVASDGSTNMVATVRSGVVHLYQHTLNGKCSKPLKPKTTIQVVSDTGQSNDLIIPIRIAAALYRDDTTLSIGHGNEVALTFENITIETNKKVWCLVRKDPSAVARSKENDATKIRTPLVSKDVHYLTPQSSAATVKRKNDGKMEVPMEKRLENLTLNKLDGHAKVPRADNVAQLLVQGLHSKDSHILRTVLNKKDETVIRNTVKRLPMTVLTDLIAELNVFVQGKTLASQIGSTWLKHILQIHASVLLNNPNLPEILGPTLGNIENRLALQMPINRLKGRLDLIMSQVSPSSDLDTNVDEVPVLVYNDKDSSDSDEENMDLMELNHSESENEWDEESNDGEQNDKDNGKSDSDSDMSS